MKSLFLCLIFALVLPSCTSAPPRPPATVVGQQALQNTRVIKGLDVLRDAAIDANATTPPQLSTDTTRKIVTWHRSTLLVIKAAGSGWQAAVQEGLRQLKADLPVAESAKLTPYFTLIQTLLTEVL